MTQEFNNPINLAVHETADLSEISRNPHQEATAELKDLNYLVRDDENVDTQSSGVLDNGNDENIVDNQITIANLSAR